MTSRKRLISFIALFAAAVASADTIVTTSGITFDGVVTEQPDGNYRITAGDNELIYQKSEIATIDKNAKTGKLDFEAIAAEAKKADERLSKETGLNASQRARVDALLLDLLQDGPPRIKARDTLVAMVAECDVYKYLQFLFAEANPNTQAQLLDILYKLDPNRSLARIRESLTNSFPAVREKALEVLAEAGDKASADMIARGLVDPENPVRIAAAYALAALGIRAATPALIETLPHPDLRVSGAAREALTQLWQEATGGKSLATVDEWKAIWEANQKGVKEHFALSDLQPLADPTKPFVAG